MFSELSVSTMISLATNDVVRKAGYWVDTSVGLATVMQSIQAERLTLESICEYSHLSLDIHSENDVSKYS